MTGQAILDMQKRVDDAKKLNGEITILRQTIAWLDNGDPITHSFQRDKIVDTISVPLWLATEFREKLRSYFAIELTNLEAKFAQMAFTE